MYPSKNFLNFIKSLLLLWLLLLLLQKINLITADLGRHIKNGELIFKNKDVLYKNFYSYTYPSFPFVNHHWGSGVIFFLIYKAFGFNGLHLFYAITIALSVFIVLKALNSKTFYLPFLVSLPLIAYRKEVRPELFSFLFLSICIWLILKLRKKQISAWKFSFFYTLVELSWVNLHILFPFGLILLIFAFLESLFKKENSKVFALTFSSSILATSINPNFLKGALIPLVIFKNYSYMLVENQNLLFAIKRLGNSIYFYVLIFTILSSSIFLYKIKKDLKDNLFINLTFVFFLILSLKYIRALSFLGLASLLFLELKFRKFNQQLLLGLGTIFIFFIFLTLPFSSLFNPFKNPVWGLGLASQTNSSANFFKRVYLKGPIFNNYDIGSYLIFHLYPKEKVFVDNRPEAYPAEFWKKEYIAAQKDEKIWKQLERKYKFNVIYFYRHDVTPWAQPFLIRRIQDKEWIPIYVDAYTLILVKKNKQNKEIIQKYKLPTSIFKISKIG